MVYYRDEPERIFREGREQDQYLFRDTAFEAVLLYDMLSHIIYNNLNMNNIESRPIPAKNWEYRFFVDFEGNLNDGAVKCGRAAFVKKD